MGSGKRFLAIWTGNSLESSSPCAVLALDADVVLTKTQNICPLKEELEEMKQSSEKMTQKLAALPEIYRRKSASGYGIKSSRCGNTSG